MIHRRHRHRKPPEWRYRRKPGKRKVHVMTEEEKRVKAEQDKFWEKLEARFTPAASANRLSMAQVKELLTEWRLEETKDEDDEDANKEETNEEETNEAGTNEAEEKEGEISYDSKAEDHRADDYWYMKCAPVEGRPPEDAGYAPQDLEMMYLFFLINVKESRSLGTAIHRDWLEFLNRQWSLRAMGEWESYLEARAIVMNNGNFGKESGQFYLTGKTDRAGVEHLLSFCKEWPELSEEARKEAVDWFWSYSKELHADDTDKWCQTTGDDSTVFNVELCFFYWEIVVTAEKADERLKFEKMREKIASRSVCCVIS